MNEASTYYVNKNAQHIIPHILKEDKEDTLYELMFVRNVERQESQA